MRTLLRLGSLVLPAVPLVLGLACSSEPDPGGIGSAAGTASQTGGAPTTSGAASGGNATAGTGVSAGATSGGTNNLSTGGSGGSGGASGSAGLSSGGSAGAATGGASGGSAGASSADAGGSAASGCVGVTSKFCDDFEAQTTGAAPKGDFSVGKGIVVDTSKAYSGSKALHITSPKPGSQSFLNFTKQFPMNDFHGRAMFYLTRIPTAEIHWDLIDASSQNQHWEIGGMYGKFILVVDPPDHALTSNPFPTGKWFCLQWQFKYGGQGIDNTFVAKMDDKVLDKGQFTGVDPDGKKWAAGPWANLSIGWTGYGSSDVDIEEWIDDLAIGDAPIACPATK